MFRESRMDAKTFGQVVLRILAVYFVAIGVMALPNLVEVLWDKAVPEDSNIDYRVFAVALSLPFIIGLLVWMWAPRLSLRMVGGSEDRTPIEALDAGKVQTIALTILGLIFVLHGFKSLVVYVAEGAWTSAGFTTVLWGYVFELLLGVALILGGKFFARWFKRLREFGLLPPNSN